MFAVVEERHRETARRRNPADGDVNERPRAGIRGKVRRHFDKPCVFWRDDRAASVQADNFRRDFKRAEHDDDASILAQMRRRFRAAACVILIHHLQRPKDAKRLAALGRRVDVTIRRQWRGGDEEQPLLCDPSRKFGINVLKLLAHGGNRFVQAVRKVQRGNTRFRRLRCELFRRDHAIHPIGLTLRLSIGDFEAAAFSLTVQ